MASSGIPQLLVKKDSARIAELARPTLKVAFKREVTSLEYIATEKQSELANCIRNRIEMRLPGRIHNLRVLVTENAVLLSGYCSTFYSKQLAQHAAMGVLEYERLINNIDVRTVH